MTGPTDRESTTASPDPRPASRAPRLQRDRLTLVLYLQLCVFGFTMYGFSPSIPLLADDRNLADAVAALHSTGLAVGAMAAGWTTARTAVRWGRTRVQAAALLTLAGAVAAYCTGPWLWSTLLAAVVIGGAGNVIVNITAAALSDHHGPFAPAAMSEANGISAGVGMLAPLVLGAATLLPGGWRLGLWLNVPLAIGTWWVCRRQKLPPASPAPRDPGTRGRRFSTEFWSAWALFLACSGFEMCMVVWASEELRVHARLSQSTATMGITLMLIGMVAGRLYGTRLAQRWPTGRLLVCSLALALTGFAGFWFLTGPGALAGIFVCGLGMSLHFPLAVSRGLAAAEGSTDRAMSLFALGQGLAAGLGPFTLSAVAAVSGIHLAFLAGPALLAAALVLALKLAATDQPVNRTAPRP
jgi:MFS family permease